MKFDRLKIVILSVIIIFDSHSAMALTELFVEAQPVRSDSGHLLYSLYNNEASFLIEKNPYSEGAISAIKGTTQFKIQNIEQGFYVLTLIDDENDNGKLDTNIWGYPRELFGISNVTKKLWFHPKWDEVKFEIKDGQKNEISILLKLQ